MTVHFIQSMTIAQSREAGRFFRGLCVKILCDLDGAGLGDTENSGGSVRDGFPRTDLGYIFALSLPHALNLSALP